MVQPISVVFLHYNIIVSHFPIPPRFLPKLGDLIIANVVTVLIRYRSSG